MTRITLRIKPVMSIMILIMSIITIITTTMMTMIQTNNHNNHNHNHHHHQRIASIYVHGFGIRHHPTKHIHHHTHPTYYHNHNHHHHHHSNLKLNAMMTKSQIAIYDGSEFVSILSHLMTESNSRIRMNITTSSNNNDDDSNDSNDDSDSTKDKMYKDISLKKAGYIPFVIGTLPNNNNNNYKNERIIAVQVLQPKPFNNEEDDDDDDDDDDDEINLESSKEYTLLDESNNIYVYTDSITSIPKYINDNDAISTASAALCGIHCGMPLMISDDNDNEDDNGTKDNNNQGKVREYRSYIIKF